MLRQVCVNLFQLTSRKISRWRSAETQVAMKLTENIAGSIEVPTGARETMVFDDALPGFGIRKFASGRASYIVKYNVGPQQRKITLGAVVPGVLAEMRRKASDVLARARLGQDVAAERRSISARRIILFDDLAKAYLAEKRKTMRQNTFDAAQRHFRQHWACFHGWELKDIARRDVVREIDEMAEARGAVTADRAKASLSGFFAWAIEKDYAEQNPTRDIRARAGKPKGTRVLSEDELAMIWLAVLGGDYATIVRLLVLTAQRKNEIAGLSWPEIDFERGQIELPAERCKNGRPHIVPLSEPAVMLLAEVRRRDGRELLFGRNEGSPFNGWSQKKLDLSARLPRDMKPWTVHDIRRSVITHMVERGIAQPHIAEAILNHVSGHQSGVAGVYNRAAYAAEKRAALNAWAAHFIPLVERTAAMPRARE
jgi:integrase